MIPHQLLWISELEAPEESVFQLVSGVRFKVSPIDRQLILRGNWSLNANYVKSTGGLLGRQYLHLLIAKEMNLNFTKEIDHKDRDKLNNRRDNLRNATRSQNMMNVPIRQNNTSGYTGVYQQASGRWMARGTVNYQTINLGCYDTAEEAFIVYQDWAKRTFGAFHRGE